MAIGIYKSGQGYWVRVLTATLLGIITLASAAWVYAQTASLAERLPRSVWAMGLSNVQGGTFAAGQQVEIFGKQTGSAEPPKLGTATVEGLRQSELRIKDVNLTAPGVTDPGTAGFVRAGAASASVSGRPTGQSAINPTILQGSAAVVVILIGFLITYYFCAMKPSAVEFLIATDMEMKKVNWSTWKDIRKMTSVVVFAAVFLATTLFVIDFTFQLIFRAIGVLQGGMS
jgi:preprotein translocase SecE subunit